jgi:nitrite reductase/ring-hydroxylating ferredoxin subunit
MPETAEPATLEVTWAGELAEGQMRSLRADTGLWIALARVDGSLVAFSEQCTHRSCSLARGELEGPVVTCPCHGAEFDVRTGAELAGPATRPLRTYPVAEAGGAAVVTLMSD